MFSWAVNIFQKIRLSDHSLRPGLKLGSETAAAYRKTSNCRPSVYFLKRSEEIRVHGFFPFPQVSHFEKHKEAAIKPPERLFVWVKG